jgi:phage tail sheath protein FI
VPIPTPEIPPKFSREDIFAAQQALILHCETQRDRLAVIDPPFPARQGEVDLGEIQSWRLRFDTSYAALYYPWVLVYDPLRLGRQIVRAIPPSGHVAGIMARSDRAIGVHKAPANELLRWAQDVMVVVSAEMQGILNPMGVNCLRPLLGRGLRVYAARTMSSDSAWRYVNVRRLLLMIEEAVEESLQWAVFEPNDFTLRQMLILTIGSFLRALWTRGALVGADEEEAFFVKCDEENNPPYLADLGQLVVDVGVAPVKPAEFVVFSIGRVENVFELTEQRGRGRGN